MNSGIPKPVEEEQHKKIPVTIVTGKKKKKKHLAHTVT
jgi:hypothetical protein